MTTEDLYKHIARGFWHTFCQFSSIKQDYTSSILHAIAIPAFVIFLKAYFRNSKEQLWTLKVRPKTKRKER